MAATLLWNAPPHAIMKNKSCLGMKMRIWRVISRGSRMKAMLAAYSKDVAKAIWLADIKEKISMITALEEKIEQDKSKAPAQRERATRETNEHVEAQNLPSQHPRDTPEETNPPQPGDKDWFSTMVTKDITIEEVDALWEQLLERSLTPEKQRAVRQAYYNESDVEKRLHMYLEFSSYLRPATEEVKQFRSSIRKFDDSRDARNEVYMMENAGWTKTLPLLLSVFFGVLAVRFIMGGIPIV
eukprot:CAMPEP_0203797376 /NCGR_PEP_ID=MMETSP0100_2-20121128/8604_1 /ASSEMBLY_ACC=CAM_ASM_000210 /TAXON_ID=96639 /ORGANISM=" , Strain NY0313808BC1" /LENGTH=240 /DNA_ID=CAMNT_0050702695 /DNA_START=169 /DNA_END=892 /DNA_ORIENTATION=+